MMEFLLGFFYLMLFVVTFGISYFATAGIVYLICYCFGWKFSWGIATGIWLLMLLFK